MIKKNEKYINISIALIDAVCIFISLIFAWYLRFESGIFSVSEGYLPFSQYLSPVALIIPLYLFLYSIFGLYSPHRIKSISHEFFNIIKANALGILFFILALYLVKEIDYSRYLLFIFGVNCIILISIERAVIRLTLRNLRRKGYNLKHVLILGYSDLTVELLRIIKGNRQWGLNAIGILDDNQPVGSKISDSIVLNKLDSLEDMLNKNNIDEVFITLELKEYEKLGKIIAVCEKVGIRTQIIPDYYKYIPARPYVEEVEGLPIINIRYVPLDNVINRLIKRMFDIVVSLICIVTFSPIMLFTAVMIKLTSPGPIFYKQERVGLNRKNFMMYKFRSMKVQTKGEDKVTWTTKDDPRKTKFGNFIRKTSIDELPQIFNVLKGDMSLVGPRPERPFFVEQFKESIPKYMVKHQVRPGITGWAQVNGWRGDTSIEKRIEFDLNYIENWNFWFDIKIMFLTVFKGFVNKNAY